MARWNRGIRTIGMLVLIAAGAAVLIAAAIFVITFLVEAVFAPLIEFALKVFAGVGR